MAEHLTLDPRNTERFLESVIEEKHSQELKRANLDSPVHAEKLDLSADLFQMMSNWYYPAILELTQVRGFRASNAWIAKQLGISRMQASMAVSQLLRLGLLKKVGSTLIKSHRHMDTSNKSVTTSALKRLQKQVLQKIIESLENDPIETRSVSSMTLAIDPKKMGLAKELIQRFTDQLSEVLESGDQQQVYQLAVGLVPLQKNL